MRRRGRLVVAGVAVAAAVAAGLLVLGDGGRRPPAGTTGPGATTAAGAEGCAPTRGEPAQGGGGVAAGAPSRARLGPGVELPRTAATLAAGRGGQRLIVSGTVLAADCATPLAGASLEVWQTNAEGEYGPGQGTADERCCYLAAALRTDAQGRFRFETVKPGHYKGEERPPPAHIHLEVLHPDATGLLTELVFAGDPYLGPDPPGEVMRPTPVPGANPAALQAHVAIVLRP
jgi:hypothetical protein